MTWYVYTFLICKSGSSIHLDFFFIGGTYYLWPPSATFWRHWGYVFSGVDVARSANVWMGKIHGWRWHTCFDLTAAPTRRWTKTISIISIIIRRVNAPRDFIRKSRALGFDCRLCLVFNQQLSQQQKKGPTLKWRLYLVRPMLSSEQIWLRWHPFFLDLLQENSPIMRPICHRNSAKHLNFLGWDCCSLFWVNQCDV